MRNSKKWVLKIGNIGILRFKILWFFFASIRGGSIHAKIKSLIGTLSNDDLSGNPGYNNHSYVDLMLENMKI